jgi:predicted SpoU family rRNA methylase
MLTRPLKERWFSGTVLLADKTPAAGAKVILIDPNDRMTETNVTEVIADGEGKFRVKGYESFPYWIDAYAGEKSGVPMYAPPVQLSTKGSVDGIELVLTLNYRAQPYHSGH